MSSKFDNIDVTVDGERVQVDLESELAIVDISTEMSQVSAKMSWWGNVWGAAEEESERVDSHYRHWRAQMGQRVMAADPKMAEWKVKQEIEADPAFIKFKEAHAKALGNVTRVRGVFEAFKAKANQLQSKGAREREEFGATGMVTRHAPGAPKPKVTAGVSAMKAANLKKAAKAENDE